MAALVNVNGRILSEQDATIPVFDHGFLYGEGVYETMRTYNRKPFLFDRHMRRLRNSAGMIALGVPFDDGTFAQRIDETVEAWKATGEAYIRVLLTRGVGELTYDPAACPTPTLVIIVKEHVDPAPAVFEHGVPVAMASVLRNHPSTVNPLIKSNNLLNNALAMQEAIREGAYEGLMRNYRGELAECSQSNFFLVKDGAAITPPTSSGLLRGVTRDFLLEIGPAVGVPMKEEVLYERDLDVATEAFLTSSTREVVPVVRVGQRTIGDGRPGAVTKKLLDEFRRQAAILSARG